MTNPPNNKMTGGPGNPGVPMNKTLVVKFNPDGSPSGERVAFTGPRETQGASDEQVKMLMREAMIEILQEDGWEPAGPPRFIECGKCQAYRGERCRMRADRQPKRTAADGCFEGLPHGAGGD